MFSGKMVRNYMRKKPITQRYSEADLVNAVHDVINHNKSYREAQAAYNVPIAVIYHRIKGRKNPLKVSTGGRHSVLPENVEMTIESCLKARSRMGWPCDRKELCSLVGDYVTSKELKTPFKNNIPGYDWYANFMKRHPSLAFKKPEHLQKIRKDARNPFVVYDFYEKLGELVQQCGLIGDDKGCFIFNADESGFNSDPSRVRAIGEKGVPLSRVSGGSGRESTTVLACIAANGSFLPPLIVFKGAAVQARWTSENAFPGTLYGASKNGWMEEPHFYHWFITLFIPNVDKLRKERDMPDQTALLLFDGHSSHISVRIIDAALEHNISLLRFPSHLTDRIQPLDKCVFGPIKIKWDRILVDHGKSEMGKSCGRLTRHKFSELLKNVWEQGMIPKNIISGFESTGIFPVNSLKFSEKYFDPNLLRKYREHKSISSNQELGSISEASPGASSNQYIQIGIISDSLPRTSMSPNDQKESDGPVLTSDHNLPESENQDATMIVETAKKNPKDLSPNAIISLFSKKLNECVENSSKTSDSAGNKKVIPRLKQSRYGEVLTTKDVMNKLKEAEEKKKVKQIKEKRVTSCFKKTKEDNSKQRKISKTKKPKPNKSIISSDSEERVGSSIHLTNDDSDDDMLPLSSFIQPKSVDYKEVKWEDIQTNIFLLVKFAGGSIKAIHYKYVCVVKGKDEEDGEIAIVGLRALNSACCDFYINEIVESFIQMDMVVAILPQPKIKFEKRKMIYSFPGTIDVFEKP